jgi:hypothetical protein
LRQGLEDTIAKTNFDFAALNDEEFLRWVTLPEDDITSLEVPRRNASACDRKSTMSALRALNVHAVARYL